MGSSPVADDEISELRKEINYDDLTYHFNGKYVREKSINDFDIASGF